jgi:hypothetical protein
LKEYAKDKGCFGQMAFTYRWQRRIYSIAKKQYFAGDSIDIWKANDFLHTENFIL